MGHSLRDNVIMPFIDRLCKKIFVNRSKTTAVVNDAVKKYAIKTPSIEKTVAELSGGNQQKVILGRWTSEMLKTKVLILDEPTKGIDVGTKREIYQTICDFAKQRDCGFVISTELPEVINLSDSIIVMNNGRVAGSLTWEQRKKRFVLAMQEAC